MPEYHKPDPDLVEMLRISIEDKHDGDNKAQLVSKLRKDMNRNQYATEAAKRVDDFEEWQEFDFKDAGEEEGSGSEESDSESYQEAENAPNIDLMEYISNMEVPAGEAKKGVSNPTDEFFTAFSSPA